jgi:hypothetical protein
MRKEKTKKKLEEKVNLSTLKINENAFNQNQKEIFHLIDCRFFDGGINKYRNKNTNLVYKTPLSLTEDYFHLHPFLDPMVLEVGAKRRFPKEVNKHYISEKYFEDKWVSDGNNQLSIYLEKWVGENINKLVKQKTIKLLDIGPAGGAITTLFALRALHKFDLLDKVEIYLLDIVPDVIEITKEGDFDIPNELIEEYGLFFAGKDGEIYKEIMKSNRVHGVIGDGEVFPSVIKDIDISIVAYTHHHMNLIARKSFSRQMNKTTKKGGFIGVVDFYKESYDDYMSWYKPHFEKHKTPPPVEYPLLDAETLSGWYDGDTQDIIYLKNSFVFWLNNL